MIFDSNYFQTIQTAVFFKKNTFKMFKCNLFMFLDLHGKLKQNCMLKSGLSYLMG